MADVADRAQVAALFASATGAMGGLDVLVNNAGIAGPTGAVEAINPEDWDHCIDVCLTGQFNCVRLAVPYLRASRNASIVNLSSAAGQYGFALRSPYSAAKWGVIGFTKSLAIELGDSGIRVNAILPGLVAGDRQRRVLEAKAQQAGHQLCRDGTGGVRCDLDQGLCDCATIGGPDRLFGESARGRTISGQAIAIDGDTRMLA